MSRLREPTPAPTPRMLTAADRAWIADLLATKPDESTHQAIKARTGIDPFFISDLDQPHENYARECEIEWTISDIEHKLRLAAGAKVWPTRAESLGLMT
jgi:hypothetical protein